MRKVGSENVIIKFVPSWTAWKVST